MGDNDESPLLKDQADCMSKCAMLMLILQRTYLEISPAVVKRSTKHARCLEQKNLLCKVILSIACPSLVHNTALKASFVILDFRIQYFFADGVCTRLYKNLSIFRVIGTL
jgi:hypothetical protein